MLFREIPIFSCRSAKKVLVLQSCSEPEMWYGMVGSPVHVGSLGGFHVSSKFAFYTYFGRKRVFY